MGSDGETNTDRIEQLEIALGYADRSIEVLSDEVAKLNKAMDLLIRRIERLESRLVEINDKVGETPPVVPPPHSAGPDVPRDPL